MQAAPECSLTSHEVSQPVFGQNLHSITQIQEVKIFSLLLCSLLSCQTNTHSSKQQQAGQCRNGELRNISFVVPILCAVYICLALAPVLGHICHLLPPFLSDNIIYFFFSGYPNVYKCPKRVCKGEMWNPVSCVSISVISAVFRGPQVHIMERKNCF